MFSSLFDEFRRDIRSRGHELSDIEWRRICDQLTPIEARRGETLLDSLVVAESLIFVSSGVAASFQTTSDGDQQIARFFEHGQLCSNITSAWYQSVSHDELVALTHFAGVLVPFSLFRLEFTSGGPLAKYWREKMIETLLFDKDLMCAKTMRNVEARYRFVKERHRDVVTEVPAKHIAQFLGITPQGLSRFLKKTDKS